MGQGISASAGPFSVTSMMNRVGICLKVAV
jgi:hypothetical protein